jgi:hypothetical protein
MNMEKIATKRAASIPPLPPYAEAFFFVDSLKRGNRHHFFGGTENPLSRVVAAQRIVEVTSVQK